MVGELGHFALIWALLLAAAQTLLGLLGGLKGDVVWQRCAQRCAVAQCVMVVTSFACLLTAFVQCDFSLAYVAQHANRALPLFYRVGAVWGGHEGSLLLWLLWLSLWTLLLLSCRHRLPAALLTLNVAVLGWISASFLLFVLFTSNPFLRLLPQVPADGQDLNPLLQDPGLMIHPPMLYLGYVGFSVVFSFAISALLLGTAEAAWARAVRPWAVAAWAFLTLGIILGSWWAYYELGWGGWWFWDPVENAALMPWLAGTALLHGLRLVEKRQLFQAWVLLLAIIAFALSLLGTFLVRSGVLISVHAFATDPQRGIFILLLIGVVLGLSLLLYAWRAARMHSTAGDLQWGSRETLLLLNNVFFLTACIVVVLGTLYPLIVAALGGAPLSVGPPYFNGLLVPWAVLVAVALVWVPWSRWRTGMASGALWWPLGLLLLSVLASVLLLSVTVIQVRASALLGLSLAIWILTATAVDVVSRWRGAWPQAVITARYLGMMLAHIGFAVLLIGISINTQYTKMRDLQMAPGETLHFGGYQFRFVAVVPQPGPNYISYKAQFAVQQMSGHAHYTLYPEKRRYHSNGMLLSETAIQVSPWRDLYIVLGRPVTDDHAGAWSVRIYIKPLVRWLWLGGLLMLIGGMVTLFRKREASVPSAMV